MSEFGPPLGRPKPVADRWTYLKFACACVSLPMVTLQVGSVPEQAPVQLTKTWPAWGVAVSDTVVP